MARHYAEPSHIYNQYEFNCYDASNFLMDIPAR